MTDSSKETAVGPDDERLLGELARVVRDRDLVPPDLLRIAGESFTWRTVDAELAELVSDSEHSSGGALVRSSAAGVRLLAFSAGDLRLELELLVDRSSRSLVGEVEPPASVHVVVESPGESTTADADELGRFVVTGVAEGLIRLRCRWPSGESLLTPWLRS